MKPIIRELVAPTQGSFVPWQQKADNIVICQEIIHTLQKRKGRKVGMIMKIDLEKAYDKIEWTFVADTLSEVGIPRQMIQLIMSCISCGNFKNL